MYLYVIEFKNLSSVKIGITSNILSRVKTLTTDFGYISNKLLYTTKDYKYLEKQLHSYYQRYRTSQPFGRGRTEFFDVSLERCKDYLAGLGYEPLPSYDEEVLVDMYSLLLHYDCYRATTKLRKYLQSILKKYPDLYETLEVFYEEHSFRDSTKEILLEFI